MKDEGRRPDLLQCRCDENSPRVRLFVYLAVLFVRFVFFSLALLIFTSPCCAWSSPPCFASASAGGIDSVRLETGQIDLTWPGYGPPVHFAPSPPRIHFYCFFGLTGGSPFWVLVALVVACGSGI